MQRSLRQRSPWIYHYKATSNRHPSSTLIKALSLFDAEPLTKRERFGIDLGCGGGRDTFEMLKHGWRVLAVDAEAEIVRWVKSKSPPQYRGQLRTRATRFERAILPKCDLVNASYSLPFCLPRDFDQLWKRITASLPRGGRFAGQLLGVKDDWAQDVDKTFHTEDEIRDLLAEYEPEYFREREEDGQTGSGSKKHWHVFSVVARKL